MNQAIYDHLDHWVTQVIKDPVAEVDMADAIGQLQHQEYRLRDHKRALKAEAPAKQTGTAYRLVPDGRKATRSYNTDGILSAIVTTMSSDNAEEVDAPYTVMDALLLLIREGAVKLEWKWTPIRKVFAKYGMTMKIAPFAITDGAVDEEGQPYHIGEVWTENPGRLEGITDG